MLQKLFVGVKTNRKWHEIVEHNGQRRRHGFSQKNKLVPNGGSCSTLNKNCNKITRLLEKQNDDHVYSLLLPFSSQNVG